MRLTVPSLTLATHTSCLPSEIASGRSPTGPSPSGTISPAAWKRCDGVRARARRATRRPCRPTTPSGRVPAVSGSPVTSLVSGSMTDSVPACWLATNTWPPLTATPSGPAPTLIVATARGVRGAAAGGVSARAAARVVAAAERGGRGRPPPRPRDQPVEAPRRSRQPPPAPPRPRPATSTPAARPRCADPQPPRPLRSPRSRSRPCLAASTGASAPGLPPALPRERGLRGARRARRPSRSGRRAPWPSPCATTASSAARGVRAGGGDRRRRLADVGVHLRDVARRGRTGTARGERLVEHAAERVDVGAGVDRLAADLLRRDVVDACRRTGRSWSARPARRAWSARSRSGRRARSAPIRTFAGLTSRWTRPRACAASSADGDLGDDPHARARARTPARARSGSRGRGPRRSASR